MGKACLLLEKAGSLNDDPAVRIGEVQKVYTLVQNVNTKDCSLQASQFWPKNSNFRSVYLMVAALDRSM